METSKRLISSEEWKQKLNSTRITKEDVNRIVMNFLVTNGYQQAAEKFQNESGTKLEVDLASFTNQAAVNRAVQREYIEDVIEKLNRLNPEILHANPELFFRLQQQILIELILDDKKEAFEFYTETLLPLVLENEEFMKELRYTVTLLSYGNASTYQSKELRVAKQRLKIAREVNAATLTSQSRVSDLASLSNQVAVNRAVNYGNLEDVIEILNGLNPQILNANPKLFFHLQQQILIELILNNKEEAFEFSPEKLHPLVQENRMSTYQSKELCITKQRLKIASEVHAAILNFASFTDQAAINRAVQCGNLEDAIKRLNVLNPEILNKNPELFFRLQQHILTELIIYEKEEASKFSTEKLHPLVQDNEEFKQELRYTLTLLSSEDVSTFQFRELLDMKHRFKIASEVNAAILTSQGREKDPKLQRLMKMLIWIQIQLDKEAVYPRIKDLSTAKIEEPST